MALKDTLRNKVKNSSQNKDSMLFYPCRLVHCLDKLVDLALMCKDLALKGMDWDTQRICLSMDCFS